MPELSAGEKYFQYLRIDVDIFEVLYALVEPEIIQKETQLATCCKPGRFLHSTCAASCQPVELVGNLIDLSRHVVIDLSGCQLVGNPKKLRTSCELVAN